MKRADFGLAVSWPPKVIEALDLPGNHADLAVGYPFGPIAQTLVTQNSPIAAI